MEHDTHRTSQPSILLICGTPFPQLFCFFFFKILFIYLRENTRGVEEENPSGLTAECGARRGAQSNPVDYK